MGNDLRDYSDEELRDILIRRKCRGREARIAAYRSAGRVIDSEDAPVNEELVWNPQNHSAEKAGNPSLVRKLDKILLFVEILAVIGILVLLVSGTSVLQTLNREASRSFILPTLTPTALIRAIVLPGGHTAPDSGGNAVFNEAEIPEHLRSMINVSASIVPSYSPAAQVVRIRIPAIDMDAPVVPGDDWESLKAGVGLSAYSGTPGEAGNVILSGHNDIFGQVFRELDRLEPGDEVSLLTERTSFTYIVTETQIVQPDQVEVLQQTSDSTLTLISCYPYLVDTQRLVVTAKLQE